MNTPYRPDGTRALSHTPEAPPIEEVAARTRVGLCLYDNPSAMQEAWAFLPGSEPFRVRDAIDLPNHVMWVSNAGFMDFHQRGQKSHHLRQNEYLSLNLKYICQDIGLRIDGAYAKEGGTILAPYIENVVKNAIVLYNLNDPMRQLQDDKLAQAISKVMPPPTPMKETLLQRLSSATQTWSSRSPMYVDNTTTVRMWFARQPYAQYLLSQQFPDSGWSFVPSDEKFSHKDIMSGNCVPHLMRVVLEFDTVNHEVAELIAFGATGSKAKTRREWVTDVEYRWIAQFARIQVLEYCYSKAYEPLSAAHQLPAQMTEDVLLAHPVSLGILAHIHWQGLATPKYSRTMRRNEESLISVWLRAYDRAKCFEAAYVLQQYGFTIGGYGSGSVMVKAENPRLPELMEIGYKLGLVHPNYNGYFGEMKNV